MHVITASQAQRFELPGIEFTALASPTRGGSDVCTWRLRVDAGLRTAEPHTLDRNEIFMVVSGRLQLAPNGAVVGPGDAVVVAAGEPIQVQNPGDEPAEVLIAIPAGFRPTMADGTTVDTPPWGQ